MDRRQSRRGEAIDDIGGYARADRARINCWSAS